MENFMVFKLADVQSGRSQKRNCPQVNFRKRKTVGDENLRNLTIFAFDKHSWPSIFFSDQSNLTNMLSLFTKDRPLSRKSILYPLDPPFDWQKSVGQLKLSNQKVRENCVGWQFENQPWKIWRVWLVQRHIQIFHFDKTCQWHYISCLRYMALGNLASIWALRQAAQDLKKFLFLSWD